MNPGEHSQLVQAIDRFGHRFMVFDKDLIGGTMLGGEFWDGGLLLPFYDRFSDPTKTAIDIGAFVGQGAIYLSKKNKYVIAVEPLFSGRIWNAIQLNKVANVLPVAVAAYSHACVMTYAPDAAQGQQLRQLAHDQVGNLGGIALVPDPALKLLSIVGPPPGPPVVPGVALDNAIAESIDVSLIKVDAQGCDLRALIGLRETIARCRPPILFEWEDDLAKLHGDDWGDVMEFFAELTPEYTLINQGPRGHGNCWVAVPEGVDYE